MPKKSQSLAEYMQSRKLLDADKVRITRNGTQTGLDGRSALMWWRHINAALKESANEHAKVYEACFIDHNHNRIQTFLPGLMPTPAGKADPCQVEIFYEELTRLVLEGAEATKWLEMVDQLYADHPVENPLPYAFRPVQPDNNLMLYTPDEMVILHVWSTGFCSFSNHMRSVSATYKDIMKLGAAALPSILQYLKNHKGGMNVMLLLQDIVKESPYTPEQIKGTAFAKYNVSDYRQAWLNWGTTKGYLQP